MGRLAMCLAHSRYPIECIYDYKDSYYTGSLPLTYPSPGSQLWGWAVLLVIPDLSEEGQAPAVEKPAASELKTIGFFLYVRSQLLSCVFPLPMCREITWKEVRRRRSQG